MLDAYVAELRGAGPVCEVGCGPGQVARYLHDRGVDASGLDLAPAMVEEARRRNPGMTFVEGDLRALPFGDRTLAGVVAFYSLIHLERAGLVAALRELARVLRPGGQLLVAFHVGDEVRRVEELWGERTALDFVFFEVGEMRAAMSEAGFEVTATTERDPYPEGEAQTRRAYVRATRLPEP
ncbi:MAG: class I SAM-dependent methyltransferase [Vicinamibacteria bacterium]